MTPEQITNLLDQLGQRLGPTGQHVFELALRQVIAENTLYAIFDTIALISIIVFTAIAVILTAKDYSRKKKAAKSVYDKPDLFIYVYPWIFIAALAGFLVFLFADVLIGCLIALSNPEYAALKSLLESIGAIK